MVDKIIAILSQMLETHKEIYALSEVKRSQIKENDAQALQESVKNEWVLLSRVSGLEEQREKLVREVAGEQGATIADLEKTATPQQAQQLRDLAVQLREVLEMQKSINEENKALIELHLEYVDFMTNTFLKEPQVSNIYGSAGTSVDPEADNKSMIDNKA